MKVNGNALRPGNVIEHQGRLWVVVKTMHTQPGKGGAYLQAELRDLKSKTKMNERFRASESVERAYIEAIPKQFLFSSGDEFTFMDTDTYEQITLQGDFIGEPADFLQEGMIVDVSFYESEPISVKLPDQVTLMVTEADAVVKGQTASASYKPAILENGRRTLVPPHIEAGTRIIVSTEDGSYVERAKD